MRVFESAAIAVERDSEGAVALVLDVPGRSVNVLNRQVMADLDRASTPPPTAKRLCSWCGAARKAVSSPAPDLQEFLGLRNSAEAEAVSASGQKLFAKLAALPMPIDRGHQRSVPGRRPGAGPGLRLSIGFRQTQHPTRPAGSGAGACCLAGAARSVCRASSAWNARCT